MSFDPRSLERLRELGRTLPQALPEPKLPVSPKPQQVRHKVETEDNPEELFRELMKVSEDGTVPEHLMARLKQLEAKRSPQPSTDGSRSGLAQELPPLPKASSAKGKNTRPKPSKATPGSEEESLYVAFGQLLLEDDEDTP